MEIEESLHEADVLVFAPHQDDEVLGCGAYLYDAARAGRKVHVVSLGLKVIDHRVRHDVAVRYQAQAREAAQVLGATISFERFETEIFYERPRDLMLTIARHVRYARPSEVLLPWIDDIHQDHRSVGEAARFACRGFDGPGRVAYYAVPGSSPGFVPTVWAKVSEAAVAAKKEALEKYIDELREPPHPRSWLMIEAKMKVDGAAVGCFAAETFRLVRDVWENA